MLYIYLITYYDELNTVENIVYTSLFIFAAATKIDCNSP